LQEIAFEEYRLRKQFGQQATPEEYQQRFGLTQPPSWPLEAPPSPAKPDMAQVAHRYRTLRADSNHALDGWLASSPSVQARLFQEVHDTDPQAAERLATAITSFPEPGSEFLGFHLLAELGRGAFGRVYLARQGDLANRFVSLKLSTDLFGESQTLAQLQ